MTEWCDSFVLVPKPNQKVRLCIDQAKHNQTLIQLFHRGSTLNDLFSKLINAKYLALFDESCGYHNLRLEEQSSYLTTFACQFGRYR